MTPKPASDSGSKTGRTSRTTRRRHPRLVAEDPVVLMLPKGGSTDAECEDAARWERDPDSGRLRIAVADGATTGFHSRRWAEILTRRYLENPNSSWTPEWIQPAGDAYRTGFDADTLPWYAQDNAHRGGFATLLGLELECPARKLRIRAVGDTALAMLDSEQNVVLIYPPELAEAEAFGTSPRLLASNPDYWKPSGASSRLRLLDVPARGAQLLIMTDALAAWFARSQQHGEDPSGELLAGAISDVAFAEWVSSLRSRKEIRNDDTTLVSVSIHLTEG